MRPRRQRRRQRRRLRRHRLRRQLRRRATTTPPSTTSCSPEFLECVGSWHEQGESFWIEDLRRVYALRGSAACTRARLRSLQAEYYVDRGFVTKYLQTEPTEGRQALEVLLGLDAARSLDDFAARPHELTRPYVDAAADEARREAARASRKRRKKDSW